MEDISDATRDEDIVARIGGDEFALILPEADQKMYINKAENKL